MLTSFKVILKRECRYIKTHPRVFIIFFLVPVLTACLIGAVFSNQVFNHLRLGIVDNSCSSSSRELINAFNQSDIFFVSGYYPAEEEITEAFRHNEIDGVLIIPKDYAYKIKRGEGAQVLIGANSSNLGIGATLMVRGSEIISTVSTTIAVKKVVAYGSTVEQAVGEVMPLEFSIRPWYNPTGNISHFLIIGLTVVAVYQALFYFTAAALVREKADGTWRELLRYGNYPAAVVAAKILPYSCMAMVSWFCCYQISHVLFQTPMVGSWTVWFIFSLVFILCVASVGVFVSSFSPNITWATSVSISLTAPALLMGGYMWPQIAMPAFYKIFCLIFPLTYFAVPMRNVALMGTGFAGLTHNIIIMLCISIATQTLAACIFYLKAKGGKRLEGVSETVGAENEPFAAAVEAQQTVGSKE